MISDLASGLGNVALLGKTTMQIYGARCYVPY